MDKKRTLARHAASSLDLAVELGEYLRLVKWMRECLESNLTGGVGYKKEGLSKDDVSALSNIGISLERAVSARIKYDKHIKSFTDQMTPAEERAAIEEFVAGLEDMERYNLLKKMFDRHNDLMGSKNPMRTAPISPES
jgi:hypothetical protein